MRLRHVFGRAGKPDRYYANDGPCGTDVEITREEYEKRLPPAQDSSPGPSSLIGWKTLTSDAAAVHPKQVKEVRELFRARGIAGAVVKDNGQIEFTSRSGRNDVLRAFNMRDNNAGYGDYAGKSIREPEPLPDIHPDIAGRDNTSRRGTRAQEEALHAEAQKIAQEILAMERRS